MKNTKRMLATGLLLTMPAALALTGCGAEPGENGYRGTNWTVGETRPTENVVKGDIHLAEDGKVYKYDPDVEGTNKWVLQFDIKGPQGEAGESATLPALISAINAVESQIAAATTKAEINAAITAFTALNDFQKGFVGNIETLSNKAATLIQFIATDTTGTIEEQEADMDTILTTGVTVEGNTINVQLTGTQNRAVINFGEIGGLIGEDMTGTVTPYTFTPGAEEGDAGTWAPGSSLSVMVIEPVSEGTVAADNTWKPLGSDAETGSTPVEIANANPGARLLYVYNTNERIAFATPSYFNQGIGRIKVRLTGDNGVTFNFVINVLAPVAPAPSV